MRRLYLFLLFVIISSLFPVPLCANIVASLAPKGNSAASRKFEVFQTIVANTRKIQL